MGCKNCECLILEPKYVTSVGEGFVQSNRCEYFYGTSPRVNFGKGVCGAFLLVNPKDSGVELFLNKIGGANYSNSPISVEVYTKACFDGKLERSRDIAAGNTGCKNKSEGKIFFGSDIKLTEGKRVYSRSIEPFRTSDGFPNGSIILQPGTSRLYILKTINPMETAIGNFSFAWWEEEICEEEECECECK